MSLASVSAEGLNAPSQTCSGRQDQNLILLDSQSLGSEQTVMIWSVPVDQLEEYVIRLRADRVLVPLPEGMSCTDAYDRCVYSDPERGVIVACYRRLW